MVNCKKCRAMKKIITSILIAAAAFTACVKNNDEVIVKNEKITFNATLDAPTSRTVLVEQDGKFHAEWTEGDKIYIFQVTDLSSRTSKNVDLTVGGKTASVDVEFSAATATTSFHYIMASPKGSMNNACTYMAFDGISGTQAPAAMNTFDGKSDFILSKAVERTAQPAGETINFENTRISAIAKVSVKNLALAADDKVVSVTFNCQQPIAGKISNVMLTDIIEGVDPMKQHTHSTAINSITVTLPEAQTADFSYYMCLWPEILAAGEEYTVVVTTEKDVYVKNGTLASALAFTSGNITAFAVNMAGVKGENQGDDDVVETPAYIEVAGIKWAAGNLQYEKDAEAGDGFATGWRIAKNQASYQNDNTTARTDYNQSDLFNFGGIEDPFSPLATASVVAEIGTDISGKLYTDQACTTATTDFAAAKYGDIAYWASNGQYRMPTEAEIATLLASASAIKATYTLAGKTITGVYFFNPAEGTTPTIDTATAQAITDEDLAVGIFLPFAGRGYNAEKTQYGIYNAGSQGIYRASVVNTGDGADQPCYGVVFAASNVGTSKVALPYWNKAFDAKGRYAIRPIYIAK